MAGYNTRNTLTQAKAVAENQKSSGIKVSEHDLEGMTFQVKSTVDPDLTFETSFNGGSTWEAALATNPLAATPNWKYIITTPQNLGPLIRINFGVATTIDELWVTRRT
jgi:hypothetical protein